MPDEPVARCLLYRPDHNGECLNCDEWADAHDTEAILAGWRASVAAASGWTPAARADADLDARLARDPAKRKTFAPWTEEEVVALNRWQQAGTVHPFTCGTPSCRSPLVATRDGWACPQCPYTQDWAHAFMLQSPPGIP